MKNLIKLKVFLLVFSVIFAYESIAADLILPSPKPVVDKETIEKTAKKKEIYPQKKPETKKEKALVDASEDATKDDDLVKDNVFIYPKKKPITVQKKVDKIVAKSTILSKKNFAIAKQTFEAIKKNKWQTALKLSKNSKDKTLINLVNYLYLIKPSNLSTSLLFNINPVSPTIFGRKLTFDAIGTHSHSIASQIATPNPSKLDSCK